MKCTEKDCVQDLIKLYAERYGAKKDLVLEVARCESQFKVDAVGDGGKAYGVFQFHEPTFNEFAEKFGDKLDYKNPEDNIKLGVWALANGKQDHWTCYDIAKRNLAK